MRKGSTLLINNLFSPKVIPLQALVLGKLRKGIKFAQKRCIDGLFNHLRPRQGGRSYPISCKNVYMKQSMGGNHACYVHFLETALMIKKNLTLGQGIDKFVKNAFASASERQNIKEKL